MSTNYLKGVVYGSGVQACLTDPMRSDEVDVVRSYFNDPIPFSLTQGAQACLTDEVDVVWSEDQLGAKLTELRRRLCALEGQVGM